MAKTRRVATANNTPDAPDTSATRVVNPSGTRVVSAGDTGTRRVNVPQGGAQPNQAPPTGAPPSATGTRRVATGSEHQTRHVANSEKLNIGGVTYTIVKLLSENSGEAAVLKIEDPAGKAFVLKRYKTGIHPKSGVLQTIKVVGEVAGGRVMRLFDYGTMTYLNCNCTYELMEYIEGGTLRERNICLKNNMDSFVRVARDIGIALNLCHENKIIHNDIKPDNIFLRTNNLDNIVLGDFGISSLIEDVYQTHHATNNFTQHYAPPEKVNSSQAKVGIKNSADYYSLGITLLELWLGHSAFQNMGDAAIAIAKQAKDLPGVNELPPRVKLLIDGLTVVNPGKRWGFRQLMDWVEGKEVAVADENLRPKLNPFVFDAGKKLTASSPEELACLIVEHPERAKTCIYDGSVSKWLEQNGYQQERDDIERLVETVFKDDKLSGIHLSANILGYAPYIDVRNRKCHSLKDIAESMMENETAYRQLISNPSNTLFEYMKLKGLHDYVPQSVKNPGRELWELIFTLNPQTPFPVHVQDDFGTQNIMLCNSVKELLDACRDFTILSLSRREMIDPEGKFILWLDANGNTYFADRFKTEAGKRKDAGEDLFYFFMYLLEPTRGYNFHQKGERGAKDYYTIQELGELYNDALIRNQNETDTGRFMNGMSEFLTPNRRFHFYLMAHGWENMFQNMKERFNVSNPRFTVGKVIYDPIASAYGCAVLLLSTAKTTRYPAFIINNMRISDAAQVPAGINRLVLAQTNFMAWLKCFYHEDPTIDTRVVGAKGSLPAFNYAYDEFLEIQYAYQPTDPTAKRYHDNRAPNYNALKAAEGYKEAIRIISFLGSGTAVVTGIIALICYYMKDVMLAGQTAALTHFNIVCTVFSAFVLSFSVLSFFTSSTRSVVGVTAVLGCVFYRLGYVTFPASLSMLFTAVALVLTVVNAVRRARNRTKVYALLAEVLCIDNVINDAIIFTFDNKKAPQIDENSMTPMKLAANKIKKQLMSVATDEIVCALVWIASVISAFI